MKKTTYKSYKDFAEVVDNYCKNKSEKYFIASIICKYDDAKEIITELVKCDHSLVNISNFCSENWDNYTDEYIIDVTVNDNENDGIWCEPLKRGEKYIYSESDIVFVLDNCNMECLNNVDSKLGVFNVSIGNDEVFTNESTSIVKSDDGKIEGFNKFWSNEDDKGDSFSSYYSYYSTNEDSIRKIAKLFDVKL